MRKRLKPCYQNVPEIETYPCYIFHCVVINGFSLKTGKKGDTKTCLIAIENNEVIGYVWVEYETSANWDKLLCLLQISYAITCDGQKCMLSTIRRRFLYIWIQRCLVHIKRNIITKITRSPETDAGQYLLSIVEEMMK